MGKDETASEDNSDENTASNEKTEQETKPEKDDEPTPKTEENVEKSEDTEEDPEDLRKVIKVDSSEEGEKKEEAPAESELVNEDAEPTSREALEQKRAILQSIKDFDFQIRKNQEEISGINQKLESVTKDLDDLVSLYEIVSEQMNPFVGLSKVTKKRIDALENFTKEIDDLKDRIGELESFAERSGVRLKTLKEREMEKVKTIDTDAILAEGETSGEVGENIEDSEVSGEIQPPESETEVTEEVVTTNEYNIWENLSDDDLDIIIERTLGGLSPEGKIDMIIDEFIESLKG